MNGAVIGSLSPTLRKLHVIYVLPSLLKGFNIYLYLSYITKKTIIAF